MWLNVELAAYVRPLMFVSDQDLLVVEELCLQVFRRIVRLNVGGHHLARPVCCVLTNLETLIKADFVGVIETIQTRHNFLHSHYKSLLLQVQPISTNSLWSIVCDTLTPSRQTLWTSYFTSCRLSLCSPTLIPLREVTRCHLCLSFLFIPASHLIFYSKVTLDTADHSHITFYELRTVVWEHDMKPLCRLTGGHCVECSPPQWPLILILLPWSLVTGVRPVTHCLSSAPVSPRVSQFSQHLTTPGPVSRGPGPASPDCQPGPRTGQITDTSLLLLDSNTISGANAK